MNRARRTFSGAGNRLPSVNDSDAMPIAHYPFWGAFLSNLRLYVRRCGAAFISNPEMKIARLNRADEVCGSVWLPRRWQGHGGGSGPIKFG